MFAAAGYFPKLSAFLTACSPCFLHYCPRRFEQAKLPLLVFFNYIILIILFFVQRVKLSTQQRDNGGCLFTRLLSEVTKGQTWDGGERGRTCADRIPARSRRRPLPDLRMSARRLLIGSQTDDTRHRQQPCWAPHAKRLSWNPAVAEEISLGHIRWAEKRRSPHVAVCPCPKRLRYQP